jgi:hypothetical protein
MFFVNKPGIRLQVVKEDEKRARSILEEGLESDFTG